MSWEYQATYSDRRSAERTIIYNNGAELTLTLRGIVFSGQDFDSLDPISGSDPELLKQFSRTNGSLCECIIECDIPIPVVTPDDTLPGLLRVHLELGAQAPSGGLDRESLVLQLSFEKGVFRSEGQSGWFEDELNSLQSALPKGAYLKACIACAYSDYGPGGHGLFGNMFCFRERKQEYRMVKNKGDLFKIMDNPLFVQETYLCLEFERRHPGTGYRG